MIFYIEREIFIFRFGD